MPEVLVAIISFTLVTLLLLSLTTINVFEN